MSKVIFLDIDGVLNGRSTRVKSSMGFTGIDLKYIRALKELIDQTGAYVVLSSDWKDCFTEDNCNPATADADGAYLIKRLLSQGVNIMARTDDQSVGKDWSTGRGFGIRKYLKAHPEVENYVILDDIKFRDFTGELEEHFVECKCPFGKRNLKKALKILNNTGDKPCTTAKHTEN